MEQQPTTPQPPYRRHILICTWGSTPHGPRLRQAFDRLQQAHPATGLACNLVTDCVQARDRGPLVVVYPDGIWYQRVDEPALEKIYREHLLAGRPVEELVLGKTAAAPTRRTRQKKGLVIVNTGNGKGKTTAALGVILRAWGRQMKVGVIQFLKHEQARFGEIKAVERMGNIDWLSSGDGFTWTSRDMDETRAKALHGWQMARQRIASGRYDLLVLDEFTYPLHYGWLDTAGVINWLRANKPPMLHLIITGRYAPEALIQYADLVTEMRNIKHPLKEQGIRAQAGIEY